MVGKRVSRAYNKRHTIRTNNIIDRLGYSPAKNKHKEKKKMVQKLQARVLSSIVEPKPKNFLKFGSFNINGMDLEVNWAINQLVPDRNFDVSDLVHKILTTSVPALV